MAIVSLDIPTAAVPRVVHALCVSAGLTPENAANAKQALVDHIRATVSNVETSEAARAAQAALVPPDTTGIVT